MTNTMTEIRRAASAVHAQLGPGLSKTAYETCLAHELRRRGVEVQQGKTFPARYKGLRLDDACRVDLVVDDTVLVQVKVEEGERKAQRAEMRNVLRWSGLRDGVVLNFNVKHLAHGWSAERGEGSARARSLPAAVNRGRSGRPAPLPGPHPVLGFPIEGGLMRRLQLH